MSWKIVFDSGCDIRNLNDYDVDMSLVPLSIHLGDKTVRDDGNTLLHDFQDMLDNTPGKTGSACPSPGDWQDAFEEADNVIAITISGGESGSYQSALIAKNMVLDDYPGKNIFVFDSGSGGGTIEFLVNKAIELIHKGESFETICNEIVEARKRSEVFFLLQHVDNVISNGRLNPVIGKAVEALKLCILATATEEGKFDVLSKNRTFKKDMDKCIEECVKRNLKGKEILISHCLNENGAKLMKEKLLKQYPEAKIEIRQTGLLTGYYAEKGGLIVAIQD